MVCHETGKRHECALQGRGINYFSTHDLPLKLAFEGFGGTNWRNKCCYINPYTTLGHDPTYRTEHNH